MARTSYTVDFKLKAVKRLRTEFNGNLSKASREMAIDRKQLREWSKAENKMVNIEDKRVKRYVGKGRGAKFPLLEEQLIAWFKEQRQKRLIVNYRRIREMAEKLKREFDISDNEFKASNNWAYRFCRRHNIGSRAITHHGQADNKDACARKCIAKGHLNGVEQLTQNLDADHIFNMDETPVYIDMISARTMEFIGMKNIDGATTGHEKSRFTVALTVSASGNMLKAYVILKGLRNVPKCRVPLNLILTVAKGGSMKEDLMLDYCKKILSARGSFLCNEDSLLVMDIHGSHTKSSVTKELNSMKIKVKFIPAKTTSYLQSLDVSVNGPFKAALRSEWNEWFENGPQEYTNKGYRKRPSYEYLLKMVSNAMKKITPDVIKRSFEACGIAPMGKKVEVAHLNGRLRGVLGFHEGIEEIPEEDQDEDISSDEEGPSEESDMELDFQQ